jgi:hypothetical protein
MASVDERCTFVLQALAEGRLTFRCS